MAKKKARRRPKAKGELRRGTKSEPRDSTPTLSDLGLDKKTSSMAQKLAALPKKQREAVASRTTTVTKAAREVAHASRPDVAPRSTNATRAIRSHARIRRLTP